MDHYNLAMAAARAPSTGPWPLDAVWYLDFLKEYTDRQTLTDDGTRYLQDPSFAVRGDAA